MTKNPFRKSVHGKEIFWKNMNKGQIETLGLVVIVLLFILGLTFYVVFVVMEKNYDRSSTDVYQTMFASNSLNSVLNYKIKPSCQDKDIGDYLISLGMGITSCGKTEEDIKLEISSIMIKLLGSSYFESYYFEAMNGDSLFFDMNEGNCKDNSVGIFSPKYIISTGYSIRLKLCK